jgi:hypothetical protein
MVLTINPPRQRKLLLRWLGAGGAVQSQLDHVDVGQEIVIVTMGRDEPAVGDSIEQQVLFPPWAPGSDGNRMLFFLCVCINCFELLTNSCLRLFFSFFFCNSILLRAPR